MMTFKNDQMTITNTRKPTHTYHSFVGFRYILNYEVVNATAVNNTKFHHEAYVSEMP